jgi:hypothetical protein
MNNRLAFVCASFLLSACSRSNVEPSPAASSSVAAPTTSASASAPPQAQESGGGDDVRPVYPNTNDKPDPLAIRLCAALHDVPATRRADCCSHAKGLSLAAECARTLSAAKRDNAVTLETAAVDTCVSAMEKAHEGCTWVGPTGAPLPEVCDDIIKGTVEEGKRCRSSLECTTGLRCVGVGPTDAGVCRKPLPNNYPCAVSVDTLAALTRQDSFEKAHPECNGYCAQRRCREFAPIGAECKTAIECGAGKICAHHKCETGEMPSLGKPCAAPKEEGAACKNDSECKGGCLRGDSGKEGSCGMKCRML